MSISNIAAASVTQSAFQRTNQVSGNRTENGRRTADDVLETLRGLMPGWTITTSSDDWSEGNRNIEIDQRILERMARDPEVMERYKNLVLSLGETAPEIEAWAEENPGRLIELGFSIDESGAVTAMALVRTLMGNEVSTTFELPSDRSTWAETIRERLDALSQGQVQDEYGSRSWIA